MDGGEKEAAEGVMKKRKKRKRENKTLEATWSSCTMAIL